ncbi:hypothetical protein, partial [Bartonella sp. CB175]|uniref:hypothetical protein n=1 Tax=Bartonella sp. CB175 TaxID=3112256 RepID=UPI00300DEA6C
MTKTYKAQRIKIVSLGATLSVLLSSVSPLFAANFAITGATQHSTNGVSVSYSKGSHGSAVITGDDDFCGADNVIGRGGGNFNDKKQITAEEQFERFINNTTFKGFNPYGTSDKTVHWSAESRTQDKVGYLGSFLTKGSTNVLPEAYGVYSFVTGCGASATGNYSVAFGSSATTSAGGAMAFGVSALASGRASASVGVGSEASGDAAIAFGGISVAAGKESVALGVRANAASDYGVAIGSRASAQASGSIAIGGADSDENQAVAKGSNAVAIGLHARAETANAIAIGENTQVLSEGGIAIGGGSVSRADSMARDGGANSGYDPIEGKASQNESAVWKNTKGAFSVGDADTSVTRKITGVAAGADDTDAVNIAQLKALRELATRGWNFSVNGGDSTNVGLGSTVDFSAGSENFTIVQDSTKNKLTFDLAKDLALNSVKLEGTTLSAAGLEIASGPKITNSGIDAGNEVVSGVKAGDVSSTSTDAINGSQLNSMGETLATSLGGSAQYENGQWTAPEFEIVQFNSDGTQGEKQDYGTVASAFEGINKAFTGLDSKVDHVKNEITDNLLVKQAEDNSITIGKAVEGTVIEITDKEGSSRKITGLSDGDISTSSTDAINGSQLNSISNKLVAYFGGDAKYEDGQWTAPNFKVSQFDSDGIKGDEQDYSTVASAFEGVNKAFTGLDSKVDHVKSEITDNLLVKQAEDNSSITIGKAVEGTVIEITDKEGLSRKITGLSDGDISASSTDAINGSQLNSMGGSFATSLGGNAQYENGKWTAPEFEIVQFNSDGTQGEKQSYNNVASAFEGVNSSFVSLNTEISNVKDDIRGSLLIKQSGDRNSPIAIGKETEGTVIEITNKEGSSRKITGLSDGDISTSSTDAINGSQLNSISNKLVAYLDGDAKYEDEQWTAPNFKVSQFDSDGIKGEEQDYSTVASAFEGVNQAFTGLDSKVDHVKSEITDNLLVKQAEDNSSITIGKAVEGNVIKVTNKEGSSRKITGLSDGDISTSSTDAINGSQLNSMGGSFATSLGGNAQYENGQWTAPEFEIVQFNSDGTQGEKQSYNNVASAFEGVNSSFVSLNTEINNVKDDIRGSLLIKQSGGRSSPIAIGKETEGTVIEITNKEGSSRKITGLSGGNISASSTDAINGSQLNSISNKLVAYLDGDAKYEDGQWTAPNFKVSQFDSDGIKGEEQDYSTVASAFEGVNQAFTGLDSKVDHVKSEITDNLLVKQAEDNSSITIGKAVEGTVIEITDKEGSSRKITGLSDGDISTSSTDAINGSQLNSMGGSFATSLGGNAQYENGQWTAPEFEIVQFNSDGTQGEKQDYSTVASAFEGVNQAFTGLDSKVDHVKSEITDNLLVKQAEDNSITIGKAVEGNVIKVTNKEGSSRKITGLSDGDISASSTDAINGSQLNSMGGSFATSLGGNAQYENGKWTAPEFEIVQFNSDGTQGEKHSYNNVASAFEGVNSSFVSLNTEISNVKDDIKGSLLIKQMESTDPITIGKETEGTVIEITNKEGSSRKITGLSDGNISASSTDAINGSQLSSMGEMLATYFGGDARYADGDWTAPTYRIQNTVYNDVGSAFVGVDKSLKNINNSIDDIKSDITENITKNVLSWDDSENAFVARHKVGSVKSNSKLRFLSDGDISQDSTEAITGGQLYSMSNTLAKYFGGGAQYKNEQWIAPSFMVKTFDAEGNATEENYSTVAEAFTGVSNSFTNIKNAFTNEISNVKNESFVKQNDTTGSIKIGSETGGVLIDVKNKSGSSRKITGLSDGDISTSSTDAINGSQLSSMGEMLATYFGGDARYADGDWTAPTYRIQNTVYNDVGSAFVGVDKSLKNINNSIDDIKSDITENITKNVLSWDDSENAFVARHKVGSVKSNSKLRFLSDGDISQDSTEAITGGQLYSMSNTLAKYFGGGAQYKNEQWIAPSFMVKTFDAEGNATEENYSTVAEAFTGVSNSFTNIKNAFTNEISNVKNESFVKQNDTTGSIKIGSETGGTEIAVTNNYGMPRSISGVKAGSVVAGSTEVVNGSQLYSMSNTLAKYFGGDAQYKDEQWIAPSFMVKTFDAEGNATEKNYSTVAEAFTGVSNSFTNIKNAFTNEISNVKNESFVKRDDVTGSIKIGSETGGTEIAVANSYDMPRSISGVKAGSVVAGSTEVVNGSQLYSMSNALAKYFGGDAQYENGQWTAPVFKVVKFDAEGNATEGNYNTVADAFTGVSNSFADIKNEFAAAITNVNENSFVKQSDTSDPIKIGAETGGTAITVANSNGMFRSISGVKAGSVAEESTEAVNGAQLYSMSNTLAKYFGGGAQYENGKWTAPKFEVVQFKSHGLDGGVQSYSDVASAFDGVNNTFRGLDGKINDVEDALLVKREENVITVGQAIGGTSVDIKNKNGISRKLTGIANGSIAENAEDAV